MKLGIGGRLLIAHILISLVMLVAMEALLPVLLRSELERQLDDRLQQAARALAAELAEGATPAVAVARIARSTDSRMSVVGSDGFLSADSALTEGELVSVDDHSQRPEVLAAKASGLGIGERVSTSTGIETRYVAVPAGQGTVARAAKDVASLELSMAAAQRAVVVAVGVALILALGLGAGASHVAGRNVRQLQQAARRIAAGDLGDLHVPRGPGELADVAVALEQLARQLSAQWGRLTAERDLLGAVLGAMEESVLVLRPDGSLLLANASARHVLSLPDAAHQQPLVETVRLPALLDGVRKAAGGKVAHLEFSLDGPRREFVGRAAPLPGGTEAAVVVVLRDVTELRRLEGMRREFVANASHELRTPVAAIRGYAETLAGGALEDRPTAERFVAGLSRQAERLSVLVDALLDLSRVESGGLRLAPEVVEAGPAASRLAEIARERADRKQLQLIFEPPAEALRVRVDPRAFDMVLGNLIDNAVKYTPSGGTVRVSLQPLDQAVRFVVSDTGPGIAPQHQLRIFERFYRVDPGRARDVGGVGLGLSIAKHMAQQSGGDIGVESALGKGSRFWLRLPAA